MADIVSFNIKIDGSNEFKTVSASAKELGDVFDSVSGRAKVLNRDLVNMGSLSQIIEGVSGAFQNLNGLMDGLSAAYVNQMEAETLLATTMRNTMDASDEEIARIKQLTAEQQRLGVVGDEVQLAAAQELATYLELSSSLKAIIPTMNDMIADIVNLLKIHKMNHNLTRNASA